MGLSFSGTTVRATLDGATVAEVTDATYARGMAGVGSGWNHARFDNLSIRVAAAPANLARGKPARASSVWDADYGPEKAVDGNPETRWNSGQQPLSEEWLEVDFGTPARFDAVRFTQFEDRITGYRIQAWDGQAWKDAHAGGAPGKERLDRFPAVTGSKVRLLITGSKASTSIWEFEVFGAAAGRK
jgi:alpha-L-fucosidase